MAKEYKLFPDQLKGNWIKNDNPVSGFIYTKKIKGFIPKPGGFNDELFSINSANWDFENKDDVSKVLDDLMVEFDKTLNMDLLNKFFDDIKEKTADNLDEFKTKIEKLEEVSKKYTSKEFTSSLVRYLLYIYFSNSNFSSCYYFKEKRDTKIDKLQAHNQRFLIKNQILIISTLLQKDKKSTFKIIKKLFPTEVKDDELDKEIDLFTNQFNNFNEIFSTESEYEVKFWMMNPAYMMPLFNVPVGTELFEKFPFIYMQVSPLFMMTLVSKEENKHGHEKKQAMQMVIINDYINRKNSSTEMYYYRGAILNFLKMIKPEKVEEWFNLKDYPILLRIDASGKEEIVKVADDFVAKFDAAVHGLKKNVQNKPNQPSTDHLTTSLDDMYK